MVLRFVFGDKFNQLAIATAYIWKKITLVLISGEIDTLGSLNINTFPSSESFPKNVRDLEVIKTN